MSVEENVKKAKPVERVIIDERVKSKLSAMVDQANASLQGIATVTKGDVVNLVLSNHDESLTPSELEQLKALHLDQVKYAFWLAKRLKEAKASGQELSLEELLAQSQPVLSKVEPKTPRAPRKKREKSVEPAPPAPDPTSE
jgi:hypothetical protein